MVEKTSGKKSCKCHFCSSKTKKFFKTEDESGEHDVPVCETCVSLFLEAFGLFESIKTRKIEREFFKIKRRIYG